MTNKEHFFFVKVYEFDLPVRVPIRRIHFLVFIVRDVGHFFKRTGVVNINVLIIISHR